MSRAGHAIPVAACGVGAKDKPGRLSFVVDLAPYRGRLRTLEVRTLEFFIRRLSTGQPDDREQSLVLLEQRIE